MKFSRRMVSAFFVLALLAGCATTTVTQQTPMVSPGGIGFRPQFLHVIRAAELKRDQVVDFAAVRSSRLAVFRIHLAHRKYTVMSPRKGFFADHRCSATPSRTPLRHEPRHSRPGGRQPL